MPLTKMFVVLCALGLVSHLPSAAAQTTPSTDLVKLGTSLNEAIGELKIARLKLERLAPLQEAAAISNSELAIAKVNVETAQRKLALLKEILEIETESTTNLIDRLQQLTRAATGPENASAERLIRAKGRLRILQAIAKLG